MHGHPEKQPAKSQNRGQHVLHPFSGSDLSVPHLNVKVKVLQSSNLFKEKRGQAACDFFARGLSYQG
jgi:hypothetical protein